MIGSALQLILIAAGVLILIVLVLLRQMFRDLARDELKAWLPHLARDRVRRVASKFPPERRDILEAWEAELDDFADRPVTMLLVALRITRSRRLVAAELRAAAVEVADASKPNAALPSFFRPFAGVGARVTSLWAVLNARSLRSMAYQAYVRVRELFLFISNSSRPVSRRSYLGILAGRFGFALLVSLVILQLISTLAGDSSSPIDELLHVILQR